MPTEPLRPGEVCDYCGTDHGRGYCDAQERIAALEAALRDALSGYDECDLAHDEPKEMTAAVERARAAIGGEVDGE